MIHARHLLLPYNETSNVEKDINDIIECLIIADEREIGNESFEIYTIFPKSSGTTKPKNKSLKILEFIIHKN